MGIIGIPPQRLSISRFPSLSDTKAIRLPAGDHEGSQSLKGFWVTFRCPASITPNEGAMRLPSSDHDHEGDYLSDSPHCVDFMYP